MLAGGAALIGAAGFRGSAAWAAVTPRPDEAVDERRGEVYHTTDEWRQILGEDSFRVMREEATERPVGGWVAGWREALPLPLSSPEKTTTHSRQGSR